jgi:hypothetical protein
MENETIGARIRQFLRELFGSRITAQLELDLLRLRQDFEERLQDKERTIASLREDIQRLNSKVTTYELTIMPHASRMGAEVVNQVKVAKPTFAFEGLAPMKTKWQVVQEQHEAQMARELEEEAKKKEAAASA